MKLPPALQQMLRRIQAGLRHIEAGLRRMAAVIWPTLSRGLNRLFYLLRRRLPALLFAGPETLTQTMQLPLPPGDLVLPTPQELRFPAKGPLRLTTAWLHFELERKGAGSLLTVTAESTSRLPPFLTAARDRMRAVILNRIHQEAASLYLGGLLDRRRRTSPHSPHTADEFPSLRAENFPEAQSALRLPWSGGRVREAFGPLTGEPGIYLRRMLIIPLRPGNPEDLIRVIPPPFYCDDSADRPLYVCVGIHAGPAAHPVLAGEELALDISILAPAGLAVSGIPTPGWLTLFHCSIPLARPHLPGDSFRASFSFPRSGIVFSMGNAERKLLFRNSYRPVRSIMSGDGLPDILREQVTQFVQSPRDLSVTVRRRRPDFAANRVYVLERGRTRRQYPGLDRFVSARFGLPVSYAGCAYFVSSVAFHSRAERFPLWAADHRDEVVRGSLLQNEGRFAAGAHSA